MSSEIVKKRGRPKKVIPEFQEPEMPELPKATTRSKSTKTATKPTKSTKEISSSAVNVRPAKKPNVNSSVAPVPKSIGSVPPFPAVAPESKTVTPPSEHPTSTITERSKNLPKPMQHSNQSAAELPIPKNFESASPILDEVRKLKEDTTGSEAMAKQTAPVPQSGKVTQPSHTPRPLSNPPSISKSPDPISKPNTSKPNPSTMAPPSSPSGAKPTPPKPRVPLAELNSSIVSNISTRAGARPNVSGSQQLPPNYKAVSKRVTMTIVALPIALVTSYILYQRLVLGEKTKVMPRPKSPDSKIDLRISTDK